jgi:hypothetical protein
VRINLTIGEAMGRVKQLVMGITVLSLILPMPACITVPPQQCVEATIVAKTGDVIHLFNGVKNKAKEEFCLNEIIPIYRYFGWRYKCPGEVGKIRITGYVGDHYLEGIVVEGNIKYDDVAMKPNGECTSVIMLPEPGEK